jgi:hypothetical protein
MRMRKDLLVHAPIAVDIAIGELKSITTQTERNPCQGLLVHHVFDDSHPMDNVRLFDDLRLRLIQS